MVFHDRIAFLVENLDPSEPDFFPPSYSLEASDGTPGGTASVAAVDTLVNGSASPELVASATSLFFVSNDPATGAELWRSDLTGPGTSLVSDILPGPDDSSPQELTIGNGIVYFVATDGADGSELWKSDGTGGGTKLVANVSPLPGSFNLRGLTVAGSGLFFVNDDDTNGSQVWRTDLATGQTQMVVALGSSAASVGPSDLVAMGSRLLFRFDDDANPPTIYSTDGTASGTVALKMDASILSPIFVRNGAAALRDERRSRARSLVTDGTTFGTRVFSATPTEFGLGTFVPFGATANGSLLAFADDGSHGPEPVIVRDSAVTPVAYGRPLTYALGTGPTSIATGDFDGDGKLDLATLEGLSGVVDILHNRGDGAFDAPSLGLTSPGLTGIVASDFDRDGKADLVATDGTQIVLYPEPRGAGSHRRPSSRPGPGLGDVQTGDFNGDGFPDLAWTDASQSRVVVALGDGKGHFSGPVGFATAAPPAWLAVSELNGDNKLDLLASVPQGNQFGLVAFLGNGSGGFSSGISSVPRRDGRRVLGRRLRRRRKG